MVLNFVVVLLCCACGANRSEQYRIEGDAYLELGKVWPAFESYREAITLNRENALAHYGLGRFYMIQHRPDQALPCFREAILFAPDLASAYFEAISILLQNNQCTEAIQLARTFQNVNAEEGGVLHAQVLAHCGRNDESIKLLEKLREQYPQSLQVRTTLAKLLLFLHKPDEAELVLRPMLDTADINTLDARMALVDAYRLRNNTASLVEEYGRLFSERPEDIGISLAWARILLYEGRISEAEEIANELLKKDSASGWAHYVSGCCRLAQGDSAEAMVHLKLALTLLPREPMVIQSFNLAQAQLADEPEQVEQEVIEMGANKDDWLSLWREARLNDLLDHRNELMARDRNPNLYETLIVAALLTHNNVAAGELAGQLPENTPLVVFLRALNSGKQEQIAEPLNNWTGNDAELLLLREIARGYAFVRMGLRARAIETFVACYEQWPQNTVSLYAIADLFQEAGMYEFAARALQLLVQQYPENLEAHIQLYRNLCEANLPKDARQAAEAAYEQFPSLLETHLNLAEAYVTAKKLENAQQVLEAGLTAAPQDPRLQMALANILIRLLKFEEALTLLEQVDAASPQYRQAQQYSAFCYALQGDWARIFTLEFANDKECIDTAGCFLLTSAHLHAGQAEEAIDTLLKIGANPPRDRQFRDILLFALGHTDVKLSQDEAVLANTLGKVKEAPASYALGAACQSLHFHWAASQAFAEADVQIDACDLLIDQYFFSLIRAGNRTLLEDSAHAFIQRHPQAPQAWLGLASLMAALDNEEAEWDAVEKAIECNPGSVEAWLYRGRLQEKAGNFEGAAGDYRRVLEVLPEHAAANNNLAYCLLMSNGDAQAALVAAQRALAIWPENAHVLHTLGMAQLQAGALDDSLVNLSHALELRPGDPAFLLDYGKLMLAMNQLEEAKRHLRLALQYADLFRLDFSRRTEAEQLLKKVI